jgi:hypothetical protein
LGAGVTGEKMPRISPKFWENFDSHLRPAFREALARVPSIREAQRLRYLADPTAYRRETYACSCYEGRGTQAGNILLSPLCPIHNEDYVDFYPEYRNVDPPSSWIEEHFGLETMADCFREREQA